jgi:hypothetical protein
MKEQLLTNGDIILEAASGISIRLLHSMVTTPDGEATEAHIFLTDREMHAIPLTPQQLEDAQLLIGALRTRLNPQLI